MARMKSVVKEKEVKEKEVKAVEVSKPVKSAYIICQYCGHEDMFTTENHCRRCGAFIDG